MVKNLPYNTGASGSIPGQGTKIPHVMEQLRLHVPSYWTLKLWNPRITTREAPGPQRRTNRSQNMKSWSFFQPFSLLISSWDHPSHCHFHFSFSYKVTFAFTADQSIIWGKAFNIAGFPGGVVVKNLPAMQDTRVWSLGQEDPLEEEMATHSSILAWEIPGTEEPKGLQPMRSE